MIDLPHVSDDTLREALQHVRAYTIALLRRGPAFPPDGLQPDTQEMHTVWEHGKRNFALRTAGVMPIVCPVSDGSDLCGLGIFDATPNEVRDILAQDPGVQVGLFTVDIHPTRGFPGSALPG